MLGEDIQINKVTEKKPFVHILANIVQHESRYILRLLQTFAGLYWSIFFWSRKLMSAKHKFAYCER